VEARDGDVAKPGRTAAYAAGPDDDASEGGEPSGGSPDDPIEDPGDAESSPDGETEEVDANADADADTDTDTDTDDSDVTNAASDTDADAPDLDASADSDAPARASGRQARPDVSGGIGCAALLLPLIAVAGAVLCFFAGVLSTASGCSANGSALCSASGPWYAFALPVFVSPLIAAGTAIAAVTVRRHRSTWLAVGYGIVFISIIVGLAIASTGSG
jgi:hypothetical protein